MPRKPPPKRTPADRQRDYQRRHPDRERAKQARYRAAERALKARHPKDYLALCDPGISGSLRYRRAIAELRKQFPDEWRRILGRTPR